MKIINGIQLLEIVLTFLQNDFQNHNCSAEFNFRHQYCLRVTGETI